MGERFKAVYSCASEKTYRLNTAHVEKAFLFGGMPARNGAAAAILVACGFTGIDDMFSGERNLFLPFGATAKPDEFARGLGRTFEIMNANIKRWTVGSPIQAPLDSLSCLIAEHGIVEVTLKDGRMLRHHTTAVRGTPKNPMPRPEVDEKCYNLCAPVLGRARARRLCDAVWNLERVKNVRSLRPLMRA